MATITSNQTGDWASTSTWVGGSVPAADDLVVIAHGHKVTISTNIQSTRTGNVTIDGNLHFASGGKMHLHGRMTINNTSNSNNTAGEFVEGSASSGSLLSMVGGSEIKISGSNSDQHGIQANTRKWCGVDIQGSEPTLITKLNGNLDHNSDYMTVDSAANFAQGDKISLYEREVDWEAIVDECFIVHDTDVPNNRIYFRQYVTPTAVISSSSGSTITVDNAGVFRVGYKLIFGTGSNRNVSKVTGIDGNVITLSTSVTGTVTNETVYQTGNERYHPDDRDVRRLATSVRTAITPATRSGGLRDVVVGDASDLNVGDEIVILSNSDETRTYTSGSENSTWRHNLLYTVSAINGNTVTVDRDINYDSLVGEYVIRMTRDIVIKACDSSGNDIAIGDQDTARVFFNVKYWTSNSWNSAPTRRVKIKYVRFKDLGYNTGDSTNFRAGVTIAGYNGRYDPNLTGSSHTESTIHNVNAFSQTGENYVDGCTVTAYALCSNPTRDGDSYPSLCTRHPYGHVNRNNVVVGSGRGLWHWSSQYDMKTHGHISAVASYSSGAVEAMYNNVGEASYFTLRMAEDYGFMLYNIGRQQDNNWVRHINNQVQNSYAFYLGGTQINSKLERLYANKYINITYIGDSVYSIKWYDSKVFPNRWDSTWREYYNEEPMANANTSTRVYITSQNDWTNTFDPEHGKIALIDHGFGTEYWELKGRMARRYEGDHWTVRTYDGNDAHMNDCIRVKAGATVKIKGSIFSPTVEYDGTSSSIGTYPILFAIAGVPAMHARGMFDTGFETGSERTSAQAIGKTIGGFADRVPFTSASLGAWETKTLTVAPQERDYILSFGYMQDNSSYRNELLRVKDLEVVVDKAHDVLTLRNSISKIRIESDFNNNRKRLLGGRI